WVRLLTTTEILSTLLSLIRRYPKAPDPFEGGELARSRQNRDGLALKRIACARTYRLQSVDDALQKKRRARPVEIHDGLNVLTGSDLDDLSRDKRRTQ